MYQNVKDKNILTVDNVKNVLQNKFPHADVGDILGTYSQYDKERKVRRDVLVSDEPGR